MKLSVIIPVYKVEDYLDACIDSILNQNIKDYEIILVDDCSPDNCGLKCDEWAEKDSRIKVVHCAENGGLSEARNRGLEIAQGEYITFVDSDDYIAQHTFSSNLSLLEENPDTDVVEYPVMVNYGATDEYECAFSLRKITFEQWIELGGNKHCYACNKIYRRIIWEGIRFPKGKLMEDLFTIPYILAKAKKIMTSNAGMYFYCSRKGSLSRKVNERSAGDYMQAMVKLYNWLVEYRNIKGTVLDDIYLQVCNAKIVMLQLGIDCDIPYRYISVFSVNKSRMRVKALLYSVLGKNYCNVIAKARNLFAKID